MKTDKPFTPEEFKNIFSKVPRVTVEVLIKTEKGVLLTLRKKNGFEGLWHIPGGTVYYRESLHNAVKRIAKEELGVEVTIEKFMGYIEYFSEEKERGYGYSVALAFVCTPWTENIALNDDAEKFRYFKELPENVVEEQKDFILHHPELTK